MATGKVLSIDPQPSSTGQVEIDETGEVLRFDDPNFANTGLVVGSPCVFDITMNPNDPADIYASNLQPVPVRPPVEIIAAFNGDLTANIGDVITIKTAAAIVTGNITINGGKVIIADSAVVTGNINVGGGGTLVARNRGGVRGGVIVGGGSNMKVVNNGNVTGDINVTHGGRIILGNANGPGTINGAVSIQRVRKVEISSTSRIN